MLNDEKCNKISLSSGRKFFIKLSTSCANIECLPADPSEDNKREKVKDLRKRLSVMIYSCRTIKRLNLWVHGVVYKFLKFLNSQYFFECFDSLILKKGYIKNLNPFAYTSWSSGLTDNNEFTCINSLMSQHEPFHHTNITFC